MLKEPMISVLMPNYNGGQYLGAAIDSILGQSYHDFEFVIVDDCSTDGSWKIIQQYAQLDERVKVYQNAQNIGVAKTLNKGLELCVGKFVARMDSDDISHTMRLEKQLNHLINTGADLSGSAMRVINEAGAVIGERMYESQIGEYHISIESPVAHPTVLFKRELIQKFGNFNEQFESAEDYDLWIRFFCGGATLVNCNEKLYDYRIHVTQVKSRNTKKQLRTTIMLKKYAIKYYGLNFSLVSRIRLMFECILLLLPGRVIFQLFKLLRY